MVDINDMWDDEEDNEMMLRNMGIQRRRPMTPTPIPGDTPEEEVWTGSKRQKDALRAKFGGKCGYCGNNLDRMHADHIEPVIRITTDPWGKPLPPEERRFIKPERNCVPNMMPSCGPCNISKGGYALEAWRGILSRAAEIVGREKSLFRAGVRFGVISVNHQPIVFHFERIANE